MHFKLLYCENAYLQNVEAIKWPVVICDIAVHTTHSKMNTYLLYKYTPPFVPPLHIHCPATSTLIHFAIFLWESICLQRPN